MLLPRRVSGIRRRTLSPPHRTRGSARRGSGSTLTVGIFGCQPRSTPVFGSGSSGAVPIRTGDDGRCRNFFRQMCHARRPFQLQAFHPDRFGTGNRHDLNVWRRHRIVSLRQRDSRQQITLRSPVPASGTSAKRTDADGCQPFPADRRGGGSARSAYRTGARIVRSSSSTVLTPTWLTNRPRARRMACQAFDLVSKPLPASPSGSRRSITF